MTDTYEQTPATDRAEASSKGTAAATAGTAKRPAAKRGSLTTMLLPELQQLASGMGISTTKMKKSDLIAAIQDARAANGSRSAGSEAGGGDGGATRTRTRPAREASAETADSGDRPERSDRPARDGGRSDQGGSGGGQGNRQNRPQNQGGGNQNAGGGGGGGGPRDDDDYDGGNRRRGRRYRDRRGRNRERMGPGGGNADVEPTVSEDDVLIPVAGILDTIEDKNTWFIRTSGYYASPEDIYVANSYVRRFALRRGDAVTGAVKQQRDGERREKYNPLVRLDTVNGQDPESMKSRVEFTKLTPLYPQERLRLETEPHILTTRVIDLVMPIGKGQRALIVSPPKAGKTMVLQAIANAIAVNNPEVHLMVVLVDERPEEVTDMQRSVKGEVIASTFDRRPQDHITVAELSIERAKRLVEMGHDVVVLLDSVTRLGRAYNLGAPASGRILSGGVDSTALYPPKRFLGAARNIENGGSLTVIATALVETGSAGDTVIFEEFKGTGNAELKLDRKIADKRVFPAVDVDQSSTRKEEILLSPDELAVTIKLRRVLHALEAQQAIDLLLDRLKKTRTNLEFLMQIAKTTPGQE
ncbi:MAG TPA: transcription termination factor Rho [Jatrophihabitantaceae bacterium]|nr:transcription termination factor Rho [Jatrophihabitantaceae bacterium]